jgi:hypothetical protein
MSPRVNRGATTAETLRGMPAIDKLLLEYETNFGNIFNTAENLLSVSGLLHNQQQQSLTSASYQSSLIGARQSKIEYDPSHSHHHLETPMTHVARGHSSRDDDQLLFESLRQSSALGGANGSGESDPAAAPDVSLFLEKYSDRLVTMVAEKMLAASSSSTGGGSSSQK